MKKRLVLAFAFAFAFLLGCERYETNDLQILTTYSAKQICSCIFVMHRTEDFCSAWAKEDPDVKTFTVDYGKKRVETQALNLWGGKAQFLDQRRGCIAE